MPPLRRNLTFANLNTSVLNDHDENQHEYQSGEKNLSQTLSPPAADPHFEMLLNSTSSTTSSIIKLPPTTTPFLRQTSPLGPRQYSLPGRPIFPPSVKKQDLYRLALKKSARQARQAKMYIRNMVKKDLGGQD